MLGTYQSSKPFSDEPFVLAELNQLEDMLFKNGN